MEKATYRALWYVIFIMLGMYAFISLVGPPLLDYQRSKTISRMREWSYIYDRGLEKINNDQLEEANRYLAEALRIALELENDSCIAETKYAIGLLYTASQKYAQALDEYEQCLSIGSSSGIDSFNLLACAQMKAETLAKLGEYNSARRVAEDCFEKARHGGVNERLIAMQMLELLIEIAEKEQDWNSMLKYGEQLNGLLMEYMERGKRMFVYMKKKLAAAYQNLGDIERAHRCILQAQDVAKSQLTDE